MFCWLSIFNLGQNEPTRSSLVSKIWARRGLPPGDVNRAALEESKEVMIVAKSKGSFLISLIWWCHLQKTCELPPTLSLAHLGGIGNSPYYLLLFFLLSQIFHCSFDTKQH